MSYLEVVLNVDRAQDDTRHIDGLAGPSANQEVQSSSFSHQQSQEEKVLNWLDMTPYHPETVASLNNEPTSYTTSWTKMLSGERFSYIGQIFEAIRMQSMQQLHRLMDTYGEAWSNFLNDAVGSNIRIQRPFCVDALMNLYIGDSTHIGANCRILGYHRVHIGRGVSLGSNVLLSTYLLGATNASDQTAQAGMIIIEDDVVVGSDVIIWGGVTVPRGTRVPDSWAIFPTPEHSRSSR